LPITKATEIAFKSICLRIGRSLLLISAIALAMAFLASIQTSDAVVRGLQSWINSPHHDRTEVVAAEQITELMKQHGVSAMAENSRQHWMIALALMVAFVGVMNAMLMSVSERFREIGTMKCLGALDGFIVKLFLLESLMQGAAGSVVGVVAGFLIALLSSLVNYGANALTHLPTAELVASLLLSILGGVILSIVGAIIPAWQAGRMQPVEAMRVEA
jgi:predicted lysophospholipase L1 biosynthesis ABC-type transport system permease subunit